VGDQRPEWLLPLELVDEGPLRALFPYSEFNSILSLDDCRKAVVNDTEPFEEEFGLDIVQPFYDLLWRFNTIQDVFTSHSTISPPDRKSPFDWAKAFVGSAIILLPRNPHLRYELRAAEEHGRDARPIALRK